MSPLFQYASLAAIGIPTALGAHRLSASLRGSITRQLILRSFIEGFALLPGIALAGFVLGQRGSTNVFDMLRVGGAFILPYAAARIAAYRSSVSHSLRRENTVPFTDRKSTRLNSSHSQISYAVFCLKKK